ncbi:MAG TPA: arginine--tRNA ligase [Methanofastidiosum sp.]|nr:arginine--tRNA ligase [Methanofastidiosum sp.]HOC77082.1 arginine--tRNA ligase [Methanofastidiosum sp.]HOG73347.1 arginine--tRNA ligase [Methanofastidiosum sp.]HPA48624.1 arginine--tRNA ligase [Methanofastidiosum sp.]HQK62179.1 arginine--tRNA ligase [Methanofastidiosum sp.]
MLKDIKKELENSLRKNIDPENKLDIEIVFSRPPDFKLGDIATPLSFELAKKLKKNPILIAKDIAETIVLPKGIEKAETTGGYINFFFDRKYFSKETIKKIIIDDKNYGKGSKKKEKVMVEYSQPNTHKSFHIGHLRNVCLGDSLSNIMEFSGYETVRSNYIGDVGAHVAKCIWGYMKFYDGIIPKENKGDFLGKVYSEADKKLKESEEYQEEYKTVLKNLYDEDKRTMEIWSMTRQWSLEEFNRIYDELGVNFDIFLYESEVKEEGTKIARELLEKSIATNKDGAVIVDLKEFGLDEFVILRSDGTALYSTKDLALAKRKFEDFKIDLSLYVVGSEQKFYFKQLFKTLELMGFSQAKRCYHLSYELVMLEEGKMSSREGNVVLYSELKEFVKKEALNQVRERNISNAENISEIVTIGALKYSMMKDNNKRIIFNWKKALDFEGDTAPYIQYAHARASSILNKIDGLKLEFDIDYLNEKEYKLLFMLSEFPEIVHKASVDYRPDYVSNYVYDIAKCFNEFYHECHVLNAETNKDFRIALVKSTKIVLRNSLNLLGIKAPEEM